MTNKAPQETLAALTEVAFALGPLADQVVFVGGAILGLLLTDPAAPPIRITEDVDLVMEAATLGAYQDFDRALLKSGFRNDPSRHMWSYRIGKRLVDVLPSEPGPFGLSGEWTKYALRHYFVYALLEGLQIKVVSAPCFLALKLEAFADRGKGDFLHKDVEDIIALIDGRPALIPELSGSQDEALKTYVRQQVFHLKQNLMASTPGHLGSGPGERLRIPLVLSRIEQLGASL